MKNEASIIMTKILLTAGIAIGGFSEMIDNIDKILGIILKGISIISFIIVIVINWKKFIQTIKTWTRTP